MRDTKPRSMNQPRFNRWFAMILFLGIGCISGYGQLTSTAVTCLCDDNGIRTKDSVTVISTVAGPVVLDRYTGFVLPDSVLYHAADELNDEFYLSTDEPEKDTLTLVSSSPGMFVYSFVSFRDPTVAFDSLVFRQGTVETSVSLMACTVLVDDIVHNGMGDTICIDQMVNFSLGSIPNANIASLNWSLGGVTNPTGSMGMMVMSGSGAIFPLSGSGTTFSPTWGIAGAYTVNVTGRTTSNCPINSTLPIYVLDSHYDIVGFDFSCAGDTMPLALSDGFDLGIYDSVVWSLSPGAGRFIGDSINVASTMVEWDSIPGAYEVYVSAMSSLPSMCSFVDTLQVMVADTIAAGLTGPPVLCLGATRTYNTNILNAASLTWASTSGMIGTNNLDSAVITFPAAGLDTITVSGLTSMGCTITDTIIVDIKDSQIFLSGDQLACLGDVIGYRAMYTDTSIANFVDINWEIVPMDGSNMSQIDTATAPNDSLTVTWGAIGMFEIRVNGMTDLGCELRDTFLVDVQDDNYEIIGESLACVFQPSQFFLVQAADSSNVADSLITWVVIRDTGAAIDVVESLTDTDGNDTLNHQFTTGTFTDATFYYVIANGTSNNGCVVSDTTVVEVIGRRDLAIQGPDNLCAGAEAQFVLGISDTLLSGPITWSVTQKSNGAPLVPAALDASKIDTLDVSFPNVADTFIVQAMGMVQGQCDFTITTEVVLTDSVGILFASAIDTTCLSQDSQWYVLNVDTSQMTAADLDWQVRRISDGATFFPVVSNSGSRIGAYTTWQTAGEYLMTVRGAIANGGCDIDERLNITVKDTAYVIGGDKQICLGDTLEYVLLQGWNNMPVGDFPMGDSVNWMVGDTSAWTEVSGPIGDTIRIAWNTPGKYSLSILDTSACDCQIQVLDSVLVRGGTQRFMIGGDPMVCVDDVRGYIILNPDGSYIDDLVSDSSMWTVAQGTVVNDGSDSLTVRFDIGGSFVNVQDTIWFSGMTDDGCEILDTFYVNIQNTEVFIQADTEVCQGDGVDLTILNSADSSAVAGLTAVQWIIMPGDTLMDDDTLAVFIDSSGMNQMTWTEAGTFNISALGYIGDSCVIAAATTINVNPQPVSGIMGDLNTCVNSRDVYNVDIPMAMVDSIFWRVRFYAGTDTTGGAPIIVSGQNTTEVEIQWGNPGFYFIEVFGMTTGGCEFMYSLDITLVDAANIGQLACNNSINVTLNDECELMLTPDMILEQPDPTIPDEQYEIVVTDAATGTMLSSGLVDPSLLGIELKVEITHECSGQTCWGFVRLEDKNIPELLCGIDTIDCDASILPGALNFGPERRLGYPVPSTITSITQTSTIPPTFNVVGYEKCGDATLTYNDRITEEICEGDFGTIIYRDWSMMNSSGLTSTCTDTIYINRMHIDSIDLSMLPSFVGDTAFDCTILESRLQPGPLTGDLNLSSSPYCFNIQADFEDERTKLCGPASYRIIRTWTIFDWCTGDVKKHVQIIEVIDREGPSITLRDGDINIEATDHSCTGLYDLTPDVIYSDNCSGIESTRLRIFENDVTGNLLYTITDGDYSGLSFDESVTKIFIDFVAVDSCNRSNEDQIMRNIKITDNVKPVPACDANTTVSIGANGWAIANWHAFDDNSWDNCGIDRICVTRMDDLDAFDALDTNNDGIVPYADFQNVVSCQDAYDGKTSTINSQIVLRRDSLCGPYVKFCCADAMDTSAILIRMTVFDLSGNENFCMVNANIQDNSAINKQVTGPDSIAISCTADITPFLTDDGSTVTFLTTTCGVPMAPDSFSAAVDTNSCGTGSIIRNWRITDDFNNTVTHRQTVIIGLESELFDPAILASVWPQDYEGEGCDGPGSDPENLDSIYRPNINLNDYPCNQLGLDHEDLPFYNVEGYCVKILRTWTLRDWCLRDANNPDAGKWEYVQLLKMNDTTDPVINTGCQTESFQATNSTNCTAFVSMTATATDCQASEDLDWTYVIKDANDVTVIAGNTFLVNTNLEVGTYTLTWTATDKCGNSDECNKTVNVVDELAPAIQCRSISRAIGTDGNLSINASEFISVASDNCTAAGSLGYRMQSATGDSTQTFTCTDLNGQSSRDFTLQVFVSDEADNASSCSVILTVTDGNGACGIDTAMGSVSGVIFTEEDFTIDEVAVSVTAMGTGAASSLMTPLEGDYAFGALPANEAYEISATREDEYLNGVTTFDIILIQRHILGLRDLETPYKLIAADVDGSGSVSTVDLVHIRKLILGKNEALPIGRSWTFVDAHQTWTNAKKPFPYNQILEVSSLEEDKVDMDFIGVKMADVNSNVELQSSILGITRSIQALQFKELRRDENTITIGIRPEQLNGIAGMQLGLSYDNNAMKILEITSDIIDIPYEQVNMVDGELRLTWNAIESINLPEDESLFTITIAADQDIPLKDIFQMSQSQLVSEVYTLTGNDINVSDVYLEYEEANSDNQDAFSVMQNSPNPFKGETNIRFYQAQQGSVELNVFDLTGKVMHSRSGSYNKGWHELSISSNDVGGAGAYIYEMTDGQQVIRKKMITVE